MHTHTLLCPHTLAALAEVAPLALCLALVAVTLVARRINAA